MSWQAYVDDQLVATKQVTYGAICSLEGAIWAKSMDWNITPEELAAFAKNFGNPANLAMSGITLGGVKFLYLSGDDTLVRGKKGANGIHICKTKTALVVGYYAEPIQPGQCATIVEKLAEYLKDNNY